MKVMYKHFNRMAGIDRCRCDEHFEELVTSALSAGAFRAALSADRFWHTAGWWDRVFRKNSLVCEVCSGKWKKLDLGLSTLSKILEERASTMTSTRKELK